MATCSGIRLLLAASLLAWCVAPTCHAQAPLTPQQVQTQQQQYSAPQQQQQYSAPQQQQQQQEAQQEGPTNLLDNLWNIAHKTSKTLSENANPESEHTAKALSAIMDTAGSVGKDITSHDPTKTEGKDTVNGFVGFFENLGDQSITDLGRLADKALTDLTSDPWVQNQVAGGLSQILTGEALEIAVDDVPADDPYGDYYSSDYYDDGTCEVEYSANYMGELLNDGHQTIARDQGECCRMCQATAGCSVWVYCGSPNGCGAPYYKYGECYLKKSSTPEKKLAYERGEGVYWTSGILGPDIQKKSLSPGLQTQMQRNVIFASGRPATWHFDDIELNRQSPMTPRTLQCGNYNTLPGVSTHNKDFNMRIETPGITPGGPVLLIWSTSPGTYALPNGVYESSCGPLPTLLQSPQGNEVARGKRDGSASFILNGINRSNGNGCRAYLYQYVDLATCQVSAVLDTRGGL